MELMKADDMNSNIKKYMTAGEYVDSNHPLIIKKAAELTDGSILDEEIAKRCFEFVRDSIKHSRDYNQNEVTCRASDVLIKGTGYCYAKSHLLAAILRACGVPTGLCYQRLSVGDEGAPYCLHGLNAIYLEKYGWYRVDARGNKPGVEAKFNPPHEKLAFEITDSNERDFSEIWCEPIPVIVEVLTGYTTVDQVFHNLPDIEVIRLKK